MLLGSKRERNLDLVSAILLRFGPNGRASVAEHATLYPSIEIARAVCRLAAKLLPLWPRLSLDGVELLKAPRQFPSEKLLGPVRDWQWRSKVWR